MNFNLTTTPEEEAFRCEVSDFLKAELNDEIRRQHAMDKGLGAEARAFNRKIGQKGWLGLGWPKEYGGSGGSLIYEVILLQEFARHEAHIPNEIARYMAGPIILHHGSEDMKKEFLHRIVAGEIEFGLGYTEPPAGSDLMAMQMQVVEKDDHFVINGQKTFNTESHYADYHWLAAKTNPEGPRLESISLFVVDQRAPGIDIRPMATLGGETTNEVFYDNVKVPKSRLVGEKNKGFLYMVNALNYERLALFQMERIFPTLNRLIQYTQKTRRNGIVLADDPLVRNKLAELVVEAEVGKCLEYQALSLLIDGRIDYEAGIVKLFGSELRQRMGYKAMEILGQFGLLEEGSAWVPLKGEISRLCRASVVDTIGGGTSEVIRNITAIRGLRLPRQ
ncbi:MAG: acyl-CoA dehydrogenase [Desulfobacteraceae bacterium]|nr:MAG: acyl-CoA dehydrogenase [Desulfobacteraceae bacterium]